MTTPATAAGISQIRLVSIRPTNNSEPSIATGKPASWAYAVPATERDIIPNASNANVHNNP